MVPEKIDCLQGCDRPIGRCPASMVVSCSSLARAEPNPSEISMWLKYQVSLQISCTPFDGRQSFALWQKDPKRKSNIVSISKTLKAAGNHMKWDVPIYIHFSAIVSANSGVLPGTQVAQAVLTFRLLSSCLVSKMMPTSAIQSAKGKALWASSAK